MKRTLLSISVALACTISHSTFANDDTEYAMSFWEEAQQYGGHIGAAFTYEDKDEKYTDATTGTTTTTNTITKTTDIANLAYTNSLWDLSATYALQTQDTKTKQLGSTILTSDALLHLFTLTKTVNFAGGWSGGLIYSFTLTDSEYKPTGQNNVSGLTKKHTIKPYVNYWSNRFNAGAEFGVEYTDTKDDQSAWGLTESDAYAYSFKPYKTYGNWQFAVQFYYQDTDGNYSNSYGYKQKQDYTEKYFEPIVQYSFDDAGTLYAQFRYGEKEEKLSDNFGNNSKYLEDIRKGTIGYQQLITQDWEIKAEYEFTANEKTQSGSDNLTETDQNKFYISALYRF